MTAIKTYLGFVWIYAGDPSNIDIGVHALLGDQPITITGGYGGWNKVDRRGRKPITEYIEDPLVKVDVAIVLDGFIEEESVEQGIRNIERMARKDPGWDHPRPLRIASVQVPEAVQNRQFVISNVDWGEVIVRSDGERIRQACTITLEEFVDDEFLITASGMVNVVRWRFHVVKRGETLQTIARKYHTTVAVLKRANPNIRDPKRITVGSRVKVPVR